MKKLLSAILLALVALTGQAQDRLIRVNSNPDARHTSRQRAMFNQEKARLLTPQGAAFGVESVPRMHPKDYVMVGSGSARFRLPTRPSPSA